MRSVSNALPSSKLMFPVLPAFPFFLRKTEENLGKRCTLRTALRVVIHSVAAVVITLVGCVACAFRH